MHGDILIILLLVVVGVAAFFFGLLYLLCQMLVAIGRGTLRVLSPRRAAPAESTGQPRSQAPPAARPVRGRTFRVCQRPQCRHVEQRPARFCSQCGAQLADAD